MAGRTFAALVARPIAHRGLHACGGEGSVENSIRAALAAVERGFGIECDVRLSRDGEVMVFHDDTLARLTGAPGALADRDAADLGTLRLAGTADRIPTLAAFLAAVDGRVPVFIEMKGVGEAGRDALLAERVLAIVGDTGAPVALESFDPRLLDLCGAAPCPLGLVGPGEDVAPPRRVDFVSWSIDALPPADHPALPLTSWTVRTREQEARARDHGAQIVFEGFNPFSPR